MRASGESGVIKKTIQFIWRRVVVSVSWAKHVRCYFPRSTPQRKNQPNIVCTEYSMFACRYSEHTYVQVRALQQIESIRGVRRVLSRASHSNTDMFLSKSRNSLNGRWQQRGSLCGTTPKGGERVSNPSDSRRHWREHLLSELVRVSVQYML
jgi:hypothetical protein